MKTICPHCSHVQASKSKLKRITCSSCGKKFYPDNINSMPELEEEKEFVNQIEKEGEAFNKEIKKLKLD